MRKRLITTGGAIDKAYDPTIRTASFGAKTHVPDMLQDGGVASQEWVVQQLMQLDDAEMTDTDRLLIADACVQSPELRVLITHEVKTMPETARLIKRTLLEAKLAHRTIVLTGARAGGSEALFNLGTAVGHLDSAPTGVWVSMNGEKFEASHVVNDETLGIFRRRTEADGDTIDT